MAFERISRVASLTLFGSLALFACAEDEPPLSDANADRLREEIGELGDIPASPSNAVADDARAIEMGRGMFHDDQLTIPGGGVSCANCHHAVFGFSEDRPLSTNAEGGLSDAHSQTLTNIAWQTSMFWNGRGDSLWGQARGAMYGVHKVNQETGAIREYVRRLIEVDLYKDNYDALVADGLFDDPLPTIDELDALADEELDDELMIYLVNGAKTIAAYERQIVSKDSPFDKWLDGDDAAMTTAQKRGANLFVGKGCIDCHNGPNFSDGWFHDVGVALDAEQADGAITGVEAAMASGFSVVGDYSDDTSWGADLHASYQERIDESGDALQGAFKTPTLRDVTLRPVFGHLGNVNSLREWIERYSDARVDDDRMGDDEVDPAYTAQNLSEGEIDDLIEFMYALQGDPDSFEINP